jgi:AraC-like DNA-binding protein
MNDPRSIERRGATVSLLQLTPFVRLLEDAGADALLRAAEHTQAELARWGIKLSDLDAATARLPYELLVQLHRDFNDVLGDPAAHLRAAAKLQLGDYGLLEYVCGTSNTLGESIACLHRYYPLLVPAYNELSVRGDRAESRFLIAPGLDAPDAFHEFGVASNLVMTSLHLQLAGAEPPIEVRFTHVAPDYSAVFEQIFPCPVRFRCEHNAIVFPARMLEHPLHTADPTLHALLARYADQELRALSEHSAFPLKVRETIEAELTSGAALDTVAARLHMSPGALRSRLRQHGTSYTALLDGLRRDLARRALRQSHQSFAEIAHQLGFAHPPAFHRAFRRWFGVTPSAYREAPNVTPTSRLLERREG